MYYSRSTTLLILCITFYLFGTTVVSSVQLKITSIERPEQGIKSAIAPFRHLFVVGGGFVDTQATNSVSVYNPITKVWTNPFNLTVARGSLTAVSNGDFVMFAGGGLTDSATAIVSDAVEIVNMTDYSVVNRSLPSGARQKLTSTSIRSRCYFAGGSVTRSTRSMFVDVFDISSMTWQPSIPLNNQGKDSIGVLAAKNYLFLIGGRVGGVSSSFSSTIQVYDVDTSQDVPFSSTYTYTPGYSGPTVPFGSYFPEEETIVIPDYNGYTIIKLPSFESEHRLYQNNDSFLELPIGGSKSFKNRFTLFTCVDNSFRMLDVTNLTSEAVVIDSFVGSTLADNSSTLYDGNNWPIFNTTYVADSDVSASLNKMLYARVKDALGIVKDWSVIEVVCQDDNECDDLNRCNGIELCHPTQKVCYTEPNSLPVFDGDSCDDGIFCNGIDTCLFGKCIRATNDSLPCNGTIETCEEPPVSGTEAVCVPIVSAGNFTTVFTTEDRVQIVDPVEKSKNMAWIAGAVVGGVALIALVLGLLLFVRHHKKQKKMSHGDHESLHSTDHEAGVALAPATVSSGASAPVPGTTTPPKEVAVVVADGEEDHPSELKILGYLGGGVSGKVYKALWRGSVVAAKQLRNREEFIQFKTEVELMLTVRPHQNVVKFLGVIEGFHLPYIITEFMERGSLLTYLNDHEVSFAQKVGFMKDVVTGMCHLVEEKLVHKDLAARNILLSSDLVAKVSDFGLSRLLTTKETAHFSEAGIGPLKWMAPESLVYKMYSEKSDVWGFGVLCIEILTGDEPYPEYTTAQFGLNLMEHKLHERMPDQIPTSKIVTEWDAKSATSLCNLIAKCFQMDPEKRPSFQMIAAVLEEYFPAETLAAERVNLISS